MVPVSIYVEYILSESESENTNFIMDNAVCTYSKQ